VGCKLQVEHGQLVAYSFILAGSEAYNVFCLQAFLALSQIVFDLLAFDQGAMSLTTNGTVVNEHIRTISTLNEAITFSVVEPLYTSSLTRRHLNYSEFLFWNRLASEGSPSFAVAA